MNNPPVILFDGVCNLCNSSVQFIIRHDPNARFKFASLQSDFGAQQMAKHNIPPGMLNSVILLLDGKAHQKSSAALEIARRLSGLWPALYVFKIVPAFIRDVVYDWVSRNRYRFFGRRETCMVASEELRHRFVG